MSLPSFSFTITQWIVSDHQLQFAPVAIQSEKNPCNTIKHLELFLFSSLFLHPSNVKYNSFHNLSSKRFTMLSHHFFVIFFYKSISTSENGMSMRKTQKSWQICEDPIRQIYIWHMMFHGLLEINLSPKTKRSLYKHQSSTSIKMATYSHKKG